MFGGGGINYLDLEPSEAEVPPNNSVNVASPQLNDIFHRLANIERLLKNTQTLGKFAEVINVS
jgi:hypothetical protein